MSGGDEDAEEDEAKKVQLERPSITFASTTPYSSRVVDGFGWDCSGRGEACRNCLHKGGALRKTEKHGAQGL